MHRPSGTLRTVVVRTALAAAVALAGGSVLAACGDDDESAGSSTTTSTTTEDRDEDAAPPEVTDVWARPATTGNNSAIYMTITTGDEEDHLVGASVPADIVATVELHETTSGGDGAAEGGMGDDMGDAGTDTTMSDQTTTTMSGGMMGMREVDEITIDADSTLKLEPGGYHVMLIDLQQDLVVGDTIPVTLTFEHSGELDVTAEVREG